MIFLGIDPGKYGAIAWMDGERQHIEVHDPTPELVHPAQNGVDFG